MKKKADYLKTFPVPYAWDNQTKSNKKLIIEINDKSQAYSIEEIEDKKPIISEGIKYYVRVISTGYFREVEIRQDKEVEEEDDGKNKGIKSMIKLGSFASTVSEGINLKINLKGLGISIVDEEPKELIYLAIYKIKGRVIKENKIVDFTNIVYENQEEYELIISHMQIDNVISKENPIIFTPEGGFDKNSDLTDPNYTPFIQIMVDAIFRPNQINNQNGSSTCKHTLTRFYLLLFFAVKHQDLKI